MATVSTEISSFSSVNPNSSYTAQDFSTYGGIDLTWVVGDSRGLLKLVDPQGNIFYNNTDTNNPDIDRSISNISPTITLPTDSSGNVIQGDYQVTLTLFDVASPITQFERTFTFTYDFVEPTVILDVDWSVINPIYFKSVDQTGYDYGGYTRSTITQTQTLFNPPVVGGSLTQSGTTLNTAVFYTTTSTIRHIASMSYQINGFWNDTPNVVIDTQASIFWQKTTDKEVYVDDSNTVCAQYCCVKGAWDNWIKAKTSLTGDKELKKAIWQEASDNWFMLKQSFECNQSQDAEGFRRQIQKVTNCSGSDCGCSDTAPSQVIGIGTTNEIIRKIVVTATSNITSYTETDLIGLNWASGDFMVFVDGQEVESTSGTSTFNPTTGEFTFGFTVFSGTEFYFQIIKR